MRAWERTLLYPLVVNIRFISTLTPEDENLMAPAVLKAVAAILDVLPIAYMLRIDAVDGQVYQHSRTGEETQLLGTESEGTESVPSGGGSASNLTPTRFDS